MSIVILTQDFTTLPAALLGMAKAQLRVDWSYDDAIITSMIARAISWFERVTGVTVNPTSYTWAPAAAEFTAPLWYWCAPAVQSPTLPVVPITPVATGWTATVDATDVTASYSMSTMARHGVFIYYVSGSHVAGLAFAITSGYTAAALPPGILDLVMRYTAHLYENREILVPGSNEQSPDWDRQATATYWFPTC